MQSLYSIVYFKFVSSLENFSKLLKYNIISVISMRYVDAIYCFYFKNLITRRINNNVFIHIGIRHRCGGNGTWNRRRNSAGKYAKQKITKYKSKKIGCRILCLSSCMQLLIVIFFVVVDEDLYVYDYVYLYTVHTVCQYTSYR